MARKFFKLSKNMTDNFLADNINPLTLKIYLIMLERSEITNYKDKFGKYFLITREELSLKLNTKNLKSISNSIKFLEELKIIKIFKEQGKANKYYWLEY